MEKAIFPVKNTPIDFPVPDGNPQNTHANSIIQD